ncbi:hypothetical protein [Glutamicibacter sp. PS]|uniref:hypothetical protein n=1 Tax=Glutamicibacter sp. PS TaxID=3075634 RepID=UPI00283E9310|nr:hypothetical protein [Glutamicibacter sp. PS]MDR4533929.1 hypothetical protein [Glutamicibacter sp. PS]
MGTAVRQLPEWTAAYALLRDRIASFPGEDQVRSVDQDGNDVEILRYWPAADWTPPADVRRLILLGPGNDGSAQSLRSAGFTPLSTMTLLAAQPTDVEQAVKLAETSVLFEAPMDHYDVVEVADFDRPVARGRMHYGSTFGLISDPDLFAPSDPDTARRAVIASFAGSAFAHGLPWIFLIASEDHAEHLAEGWSKATTISIWQQS